MGLMIYSIDFKEFAQEPLLRSNYKTAIVGIQIKTQIRNSKSKFCRLKEYFYIVSGFAFKSLDYTSEGVPLIRIGDVDNGFDEDNMVFLPEYYKDDYSKYLLKKDDIIVSLTGEGKLKSDLIFGNDKYLLNQRVGSLRAKEQINILFYYYLLNNFQLIKKQFYWWSNGKTQLNISPFDFLKIKIPLLPISKQDQIVSEIKPIEKKIKELKAQIAPQQEVINRVFAREFKFDLDRFEELKKIRNYNLDLFSFGNNRDIRQSVKFHRKAGIFVIEQLKKITDRKIKHFIAEPIVLGTSVSPANYDENGDYYYVSMANIKNWKFESEDSKLVSIEYSNQNQNKTVKKDDILIARSGEGTIGKVALIEDVELQGIFADFTMRLRLKDYNSLFAYYYFRTEYFQYLIEVNKKGLGNNTNIFPSQIQELPMINISLREQNRIVEEIKTELDNQELSKKQIFDLRNEIDKIIERCLT